MIAMCTKRWRKEKLTISISRKKVKRVNKIHAKSLGKKMKINKKKLKNQNKKESQKEKEIKISRLKESQEKSHEFQSP